MRCEVFRSLLLFILSFFKRNKTKNDSDTPSLNIDPVISMSDDGVMLLKYFEGLSLKAYADPASGGKPWTIGYGHTGPDVHDGLVWSQAQADKALRDRLSREFVPGVLAVIKRSMRQCELDAMVDLAYNVGVAAFQRSTLVRKFNAGDTQGAADEFLRWDKAGGKTLPGLTRRRHADRALFLGATGKEAIEAGSGE
jgi:lysozyme